jgi:trehalose 6-phosphate phosphatase
MKRLFSPDGEAALAATMRREPLLAFDLDGTLAPLVDEPDQARVPEPVVQRLQRIAALWPIAIITGRTVQDACQRLPFAPWRIVGSHGAETARGSRTVRAAEDLDAARLLLRLAREELVAAGVTIEDKRASIALHFRAAPDRQRAIHAIAKALQGLPPFLNLFSGKAVANIVAGWANDKSQALAELVAEWGARSALFVGDDINDEPVFARDEPTWLTIRVGQDYPNSQARYFVDGVEDMPRLLDLVLDAHPSR